MGAIVAVTGVHGFCGPHLVSRLQQEEGLRVVGLGRRGEAPGQCVLHDYIRLDLTDYAEVCRTFAALRPDWVFHLAGAPGGTPVEMYRANVLTTVNLLEALVCQHPAARVLLVGSAGEYGHMKDVSVGMTEDDVCRPLGPNGVSKYSMTLAGLDYVKRFSMKVVVARPFNIVGAGIPDSLLVGAIMARLRALSAAPSLNAILRVGNLRAERDFVAVEDAVDAYVRMLRGEHWGEIFNICSGQPRSVAEVVALMLREHPGKVQIETDPSLVRPLEVPSMYGSWHKASRAFGFRPTLRLEDSIARAWRQVPLSHR